MVITPPLNALRAKLYSGVIRLSGDVTCLNFVLRSSRQSRCDARTDLLTSLTDRGASGSARPPISCLSRLPDATGFGPHYLPTTHGPSSRHLRRQSGPPSFVCRSRADIGREARGEPAICSLGKRVRSELEVRDVAWGSFASFIVPAYSGFVGRP